MKFDFCIIGPTPALTIRYDWFTDSTVEKLRFAEFETPQLSQWNVVHVLAPDASQSSMIESEQPGKTS